MVSIRVVERIMAPQERVFEFISDFEKAPQYSSYWKSVKAFKRDGNTTTYETTSEAEGRKVASVTRITSFPNEKIEAETVEGDGKGTKLTFRLQKTLEGTQLSLEGEVVLPAS